MKGYLIALKQYFPNNLESRSIIYYNFLVDHKIHVGTFRVSFVEQMATFSPMLELKILPDNKRKYKESIYLLFLLLKLGSNLQNNVMEDQSITSYLIL